MQWDIVCFCETRAPTADVLLDGGHRLIASLGDSRHLGVAVLLHQRHADAVSRIQLSSGRMMSIDLNVNEVNFRVVAAYAPHCGYGAVSLEEFYTGLHEVIDCAKKPGTHVVVGGDFNTQLNCGVRTIPLLSFAAEHDLAITCDRPELPWSKKWT